MKISQFLALISVSVFLTGCGGYDYDVTYNTVPQGASLICKGRHEGYTPTTLSYDVIDDAKKRGYFSSAPCKAKWASGVEEKYGNFWDLEKFPDGVMQTLQRPDDGNYSQDAEFALKVQGMRYQQQTAESAADAASAVRNAASALQQLNTPKFILPPPVPITFGTY